MQNEIEMNDAGTEMNWSWSMMKGLYVISFIFSP